MPILAYKAMTTSSLWVFLAVGMQQIGALPPPTDVECGF